MIEQLKQIASTRRQVTFPVGTAHEKNLERELKLQGIRVKTNSVQAEGAARLKLNETAVLGQETKAFWATKNGQISH